LLIGGYIVADMYQEKKEREYRELRGPEYVAHALSLLDQCDLLDNKCSLESRGLRINLSAQNNRYHVKSNYKVDHVTMTLAQDDKETRALSLTPHRGFLQWSTKIRTLSNLDKNKALLIRIVIFKDNIQYYAQIPITINGPWSADP